MTPRRLVPALLLAALLPVVPPAIAGASVATDALCNDLALDPCVEPGTDCAAAPGDGSHASASCTVAVPGAALACSASVSSAPAAWHGCIARASTADTPFPCRDVPCPEPCVGEPVGCVEIPDFPVSETICTPVSGFLVMCYDIVCMYFQQPPWWFCYVTAPYEAWIG